MINRTFADLVQDLKQRREVGDLPPVLLLGAGASISAGIGAMSELFAFVKRKDFNEFVEYIQPLTAAERFRLLARFLQTRKPADITPGYRALARLCAEGYFDLILTTNLDPLMDDALAAARLWRRDYMLIVNGITRPDRFGPLLTAQSPRVKIIKLHGDLFQRFMAWTPAEMDAYIHDIGPNLTPVLKGRDVLVIGNSLRDDPIRELALSTEGALWYTNPFGVPDVLKEEERVRAVVSPEANFETIFTSLVNELGLAPAESATPTKVTRHDSPSSAIDFSTPTAVPSALETGRTPTPPIRHTLDDLLAATVSLATPDGQAVCTGFVLADPHVIVTDGYQGNTSHFIKDGKVTIFSMDRRQFETSVLRQNDAHPFGPIILVVPDDLEVPGLRLDTSPLREGDKVRICVSTGERIGVSHGVVQAAKPTTMNIAGLGDVSDLVAINSTVKPGASGAPVVDEEFEVRGFIVAGGDKPPALMLPATAWAHIAANKPKPRTTRRAALR